MTQTIQLTLEPSCTGEQVIYIPFLDNLENENIYDWEYETPEEALDLLTQKWKKKSFGYDSRLTFTLKLVDVYTTREAEEVGKRLSLFIEEKKTELPIVNNPFDTGECAEFDIICFEELMCGGNLYSRPYDSSPNMCRFSCYYAEDCYRGDVYSKDYTYFDCKCCDRTICEQNPSNGWHVQYRIVNECEYVCTKCYEEQMMSEGVDIDELLRTRTIPGAFASSSELESAGFAEVVGLSNILVGNGYSGYQSEGVFFNRVQEKYEELKDKIVFIEYVSMSIGGLGGYITVWSKSKN
jgi:hypothetical protein